MDGSSESFQVILWMILGLTLLSSEAFTGSFHLLFFGLAALLMAVLASLGITIIPLQLAIFTALCLATGVLVRERMKRRSLDEFALGEDAEWIVDRDFAPFQAQDVSYRGASWRASNASATELKKGQTVHILRTEGTTLVLSQPVETPSSRLLN
ncbi:MAG: hypothetical protein KF789_08715 [Bdellovibrionaceae bacterium]|nr:hypothetical protein [Pseudobdellovibrionaceae bacterium]